MVLRAPDWNAARRAAHGCGHVLAAETVSLTTADRRILAVDLHALTPLPPHAASAMDGWAVCGNGPWIIVDAHRAGDSAGEALVAGTAVAVATGAALPFNSKGILRSEHGTVMTGGLLEGYVAEEQDIRPAGEEATEGELLVPAGTRLAPAHLGLVAAAGHDALPVIRRPRARFLVLGDELLRSGVGRDGKVRDSLGPQVPAWLARLGVDVVDVAWVPDTLAAHVAALAACTDVDLVITSGGTAAGPVDFVHRGLRESGGELVIDTVAVRPGHPMLVGRWADDRWLVGLPGNPQAAVVALMTLCAPLVEGLAGLPLTDLGRRHLTDPVISRGERTRLVACREVGDRCTPADYIGSGMLRGLAAADGFAVVPHGQGVVGDAVDWLPFP
jgi:molybdopterin molybdotransferase